MHPQFVRSVLLILRGVLFVVVLFLRFLYMVGGNRARGGGGVKTRPHTTKRTKNGTNGITKKSRGANYSNEVKYFMEQTPEKKSRNERNMEFGNGAKS